MRPSIRSRSPLSLLAGATALAAMIAAASPAHADRNKAKEFYDQAEKQYNLGKFDAAVDLYTKAYEEWPEPGFLFNIAQAYRQAGNCGRALFFYKRFLSLKAADQQKPIAPSLRQEVEARITELEECTKRELANKPPDGQMAPDSQQSPATTTAAPPTNVATATSADVEEDAEVVGAPVVFAQPTTVSVRLSLGGGKLLLPGIDHQDGIGFTPVQTVVAVTAGYPIGLTPELTLEAGATGTYMTVRQKTSDTGSPEYASQIGALANAALTFAVNDRIGLRVDAGAGILRFAGFSLNSPYTTGVPMDEQKDAVTVFQFRLGLSAEYAFTPNLVGIATPLVYSHSPTDSGLNPQINSMQRIDFMVGIGYRM